PALDADLFRLEPRRERREAVRAVERRGKAPASLLYGESLPGDGAALQRGPRSDGALRARHRGRAGVADAERGTAFAQHPAHRRDDRRLVERELDPADAAAPHPGGVRASLPQRVPRRVAAGVGAPPPPACPAGGGRGAARAPSGHPKEKSGLCAPTAPPPPPAPPRHAAPPRPRTPP